MHGESRAKREALTISSLVLMLSVMPLLSLNPEVQVEQWVPYTPFSSQVELAFWMKDEEAYVDVTITFYSGGFEVRNWGVINQKDNEIWVDAEIWRWTGVTIQAVLKTSHTYNLGYLKDGEYTFTFRTWGQVVKSLIFVIIRRVNPGTAIPLPY